MKTTKAEIKRRIAENTKEIKRQVRRNQFDLKKFHGVDAEAGEISMFTLAAKAFDILAAVHVGALPYLKERHGADGVMIKRNMVVDVEFKTCARTISEKNAFITERGTVYTTSPKHESASVIKHSQCALIESYFNAAFDVKDKKILQTKRRDTYLLTFDEVNNRVIDCYIMDGDNVVAFLETSNNIKMGSFIKYGKPVELVSGPVIGWHAWRKELADTLTVKRAVK